MILFLHGAGERGTKLEYVKRHGVPRIVEEQEDFPFIVASPQCPRGQYWSVSLLSALLDEVIGADRLDPDRVYLTGISMGGYGTWRLAAAEPHRFAAVAPICGGGNPDEACNLKGLPVWAFHGARDTVVPSSESEEMVSALKACGGNVQFTVYPEAEHDSWTQTYNNPALYDWFLATPAGFSRALKLLGQPHRECQGSAALLCALPEFTPHTRSPKFQDLRRWKAALKLRPQKAQCLTPTKSDRTLLPRSQ